MNHKVRGVLLGVLGLVAVVYGIKQMTSGFREVAGTGVPTVAEARQAAQDAAGNLAPFVSTRCGISLQYPKDWATEAPAAGPILFKFKTMSGVVNASVMAEDLPAGTSWNLAATSTSPAADVR